MRKINNYIDKLDNLSDVPLLLMRLVLAYGFWGPGTKKYENFEQIIVWFESLGIPFPTLNAYLATATEIIGAIFLLLGIFTRIISFPLIIVMLVAIFTVHIEHGFDVNNNGYEIPLYYILMLLTLITLGAGRYSLDYLISTNLDKKSSQKQ